MAKYKKLILSGHNVSELTNDAGYITSVGSVSWGDISGKPSIFMHDYATVTGNPTFAGTNLFTGTTIFRNTTTQIQNTTAWSGKATLGFKVTGTGGSDFYGGIQLTRQGSSGYNSQLEFQTSVYNNNLRTVATLNSAGSLHLDGTVYANGVIGKNSGGFAIGSIADYNRIDFQSGTFRTLFANGSIAPLQVGDLTASSINGGLTFDSNSKATFSQGLSVINSVPFLYVGDNVNNNSGTWDANIFLDSHANSRLRLHQRSDNKNLELFVHGGYEPLIQATDSSTKLRLGVGGQVGLELDQYSVHLNFATYVQSLRANNSSGLITIYNQGYGSKGNLELNNITGANATFSTKVTTGKLRFTDLNSATGTNSLMIASDGDVYTRELGSNAFTSYTDHSTQGYLTRHQDISGKANLSDPTFVTRINTPQVRFT